MIAMIDYDAGNMMSVEKSLRFLGQEVVTTGDRDLILKADKVILPGVGAFAHAMDKLESTGLDNVIREVVNMGTPFLGICLGQQLLFESSDEAKGVKGLGILKGKVKRIPDKENFKVPHMGWNKLELSNNGRLFKGFDKAPYVYFVHSYYVEAEDESIVKASTFYNTKIHASVESGNIFACQFHPEKSGIKGLKILQNFVDLKGDVKNAY